MRGTDPKHADNVALRRAMDLGKLLAWLRGVGRACDSFVVGVRPDYVIEVRRDALHEVDGPTLHALQGIDGSELVVPTRRSARPDRELLEARYKRFRAAG